MNHPIPQNSQQQFMVHWIGTGKDDKTYCNTLTINSNIIWQILNTERKKNQVCIFLPKLYKRCLQTVQRRMGQRQGCHDILQETH